MLDRKIGRQATFDKYFFPYGNECIKMCYLYNDDNALLLTNYSNRG